MSVHKIQYRFEFNEVDSKKYLTKEVKDLYFKRSCIDLISSLSADQLKEIFKHIEHDPRYTGISDLYELLFTTSILTLD